MTHMRPTDRKDRAANILQARMSWPDAERYATELDQKGVLDSGDEPTAVTILTVHMPARRAEALIRDLRMYGAMAKTEE
jgi:hypothetical protein